MIDRKRYTRIDNRFEWLKDSILCLEIKSDINYVKN